MGFRFCRSDPAGKESGSEIIETSYRTDIQKPTSIIIDRQ